MSKFVAECPIEECGFTKKSYWKNATRGTVLLHIYQMDGRAHGPKGSRPEEDFEIEVRKMKGE